MNIEHLREFCLSLPNVTEDVKWDDNLCFLIGGKIFCITGLDGPFTVSLKVRDEEFDELASSTHIIPAPYLARYKWVLVEKPGRLTKKEWGHYITQSYNLIKSKLPKKILNQLG